MNADEPSTSKAKPYVKYVCTHCGKDGHIVEFCFRLAKQRRKKRTKAMSNFKKTYFASSEVVAPRFMNQVKQTLFVDRNMTQDKSVFNH